jgi:hypothetical protein
VVTENEEASKATTGTCWASASALHGEQDLKAETLLAERTDALVALTLEALLQVLSRCPSVVASTRSVYASSASDAPRVRFIVIDHADDMGALTALPRGSVFIDHFMFEHLPPECHPRLTLRRAESDPRQHRWIDVAERLPEHDQPVLARFKPVDPLHEDQPDFDVVVAAFDAEKAKLEGEGPPPRSPRSNWYRYAARGDCAHYFRATHWMPLPE